MSTSIKKYPIRVVKKGKKRGRPSKEERDITPLLSYIMSQSDGEVEIRRRK